MERLLIHPPFADPTQPYLSLPTLKGWLRARGLDATVVDLNVEAAHWLFEPETLKAVGRRIGQRFSHLNRERALSFDEQREYIALERARLQFERALAASPAPLEVFRTRELFYDAAQYAIARRTVDGYFEALSAANWPYKFSFNHASHSVVPWSFDLLDTYWTERRSPLHGFYERTFASFEEWDWESDAPAPRFDLSAIEFVGISVVFPSQIPEALYLCRFLRERLPNVFLALGGPALHQVTVHADDVRKLRLLGWVDAIGLYEGEATLAELFPRLETWRAAATSEARFDVLQDVPNLLVVDPRTETLHIGPRFTLDLREAELPDYSDLDLDRYLAPSRTLLYAPTRGCYWGKCSFCYYGLTDTATAAYREIPPERAASDLATLSRRYGVKNVYISCDVLSPKYAVKLAEALIEKNVKIRWSSDLKIEKYFTPERCELLFRSGLRSAAFGIESGSDRILELMRKGVTRETLTEVNRNFHAAGIATEWMTFTDHPDESHTEALATIRWIEDEAEHVDLFIVGKFGLEAGSHIAQEPLRYGIRSVYYTEGDDLRLYAEYTHRSGRRPRHVEEDIEAELDRVAAPWTLHPYPWAGANSTHHTFLHFLEYGPRVFRTHFQRAPEATHGTLPLPPISHIGGMREKPRYDAERIEENVREFFAEYLKTALYTTIPSRRAGGSGSEEVAPLTVEHYAEAAAAVRLLFARS
jgi:anaerobic magnesium-protoporphyrin IX monomethyl ester cyclase